MGRSLFDHSVFDEKGSIGSDGRMHATVAITAVDGTEATR